MPLSGLVHRFPALRRGSFHGLPGLLADSLPDRFSNALIDSWLAALPFLMRWVRKRIPTSMILALSAVAAEAAVPVPTIAGGKAEASAVATASVGAIHGPQLSVDADAQAYRRIRIEVAAVPDARVAKYEVWVADQDFRSTREARLHSVIAVGEVAGLERGPAGVAHDACWSDGRPIHRDASGGPVLDARASRWSCALSGMMPGRVQWIAVLPVDALGAALLDPKGLHPLAARTDAPDQRTPPPDTRPILFALAAIVLSAIVLLTHLRRRDLRQGRNRTRNAHLYVAPALLMLAMLTLYPILYGIWLAFTDADQSRLGDESWVGLANFALAFAGPGMWRMALFTLIWTLTNVAAHVVLGLALALALNHQRLAGRTLYRTVLLLPWAIPGYISVLAWNGMLQPDGLVNGILGTGIEFLAGATSARASVILVNIWLGVPFMMMVFSGALQGISPDMFEAARIDGVSRWRQFRHLTLPNLKSTLVPVSLLGFIWTFNMFNTIYLMTGGNPYVGFGEPGATDILVTHIFTLTFEHGQYGLAAAGSVLVFLMLIGFSWAYLSRTRATEAAA